MAQEIKAEDIAEYLDDRDDFTMELFALRALRERGWIAHHGGSYPDPLQPKLRQYDVRARFQFTHRRDLSLAVECKSLSKEFPLVVSRVPRPEVDAYHDVIQLWKRPQADTIFTVEPNDPNYLRLYDVGGPVGKSMTQLKCEINKQGVKKFTASDADTHDKWTQSLASASELAAMASQATTDSEKPTFTFVMPVLVVNDETLWTVDYDEEGNRGVIAAADDVQYFVDREQVLKGRYGSYRYRFTHLHIFTRIGFLRMLQNYASPTGLMLDRIFGSAMRKAGT
jgi:hypothetical protein